MSIETIVIVTCDQCQKKCKGSYIRISSEDLPNQGFSHAMGYLGDLIFCSWDCIRKWGIKE